LRFPLEEKQIPKNGIYILFEDGEYAHGTQRIVRVGTHTGKDQLPSRLRQHFEREDKDRSIFRKNIGRALLTRAKDGFADQWEWDLTARKEKEMHGSRVDLDKLRATEKAVSEYIQAHFGFAVFRVDHKTLRLLFERKLISTISICQECKPSPSWLGLNSPKEKIRQSGLWLVNELYGEELSTEELQILFQNNDRLTS
jgi:hypothetical protein